MSIHIFPKSQQTHHLMMYKHHVHQHHTVEQIRKKQKLPELLFRLWVRSHVPVLYGLWGLAIGICHHHHHHHQTVNGEVELRLELIASPELKPCVWYYCFNNLTGTRTRTGTVFHFRPQKKKDPNKNIITFLISL